MPKSKTKLPMKEQLRLLLKVQEFDSQLLEVDLRKAFFPDLLVQLQEEIDKLEKEFGEKAERLVEVKKEIGLLELEVESENTGFQKSQKKLTKVTTNKEYDAVQLEIQTHEVKIGEAEQRIIVLMDEQENLERDVEKLETEVKETIAKNKNRIKEIKRNSQEIDSVIAKIQKKRDKVSSQISPQLLNRYRQIRSGREGIAVVPIVERACGGCRISLPPQTIQEVRAGKLVICESCGRLIVDIEYDKAMKSKD